MWKSQLPLHRSPRLLGAEVPHWDNPPSPGDWFSPTRSKTTNFLSLFLLVRRFAQDHQLSFLPTQFHCSSLRALPIPPHHPPTFRSASNHVCISKHPRTTAPSDSSESHRTVISAWVLGICLVHLTLAMLNPSGLEVCIRDKDGRLLHRFPSDGT